MATYALVSGKDVINTVVADSEASLGAMALVYDVIDVTDLEFQPSTGWTRENGIFYPPHLSDVAKSQWTENGFSSEEIIEVEAIEETPAIEEKKKGK